MAGRKMPFTGKIALDAAQRVMDTAKGGATFELELLAALMDMCRCK
jgi:hypothetical protein